MLRSDLYLVVTTPYEHELFSKKVQKSGSEKGPKKGPVRCPCSPLMPERACFFSGPKSWRLNFFVKVPIGRRPRTGSISPSSKSPKILTYILTHILTHIQTASFWRVVPNVKGAARKNSYYGPLSTYMRDLDIKPTCIATEQATAL